jgi:hypothetical protein
LPFEIDVASLPGILQVTFTGPVSVKEREQALEAARPLLSHSPRILVDFANAAVVATVSGVAMRHAESLALAFADRPGARVAYVTRMAHHAPLVLAALAAVRGYFYRAFTDRDMALQWLRSSASETFVFPK